MTRATTPRNERGFALEATFMVLLLVSVLIGAAALGAATVVRTAGHDYRNARVFYAAEGSTEAIMADIQIALEDGYLDSTELDDISPEPIEGFELVDLQVKKDGAVVQETITDGPFAGLYSLTQRVNIFAETRDVAENASALHVAVKAQAIPIFQFGVFFEKDLEATNGPPMEFAGWVHSNGNIYLSSNNAWYRDVITTPNKVFHDRKDHHNVYNGVFINDALGNEVQLDFDSRTHPTADAFRAQSDARFDNRLKTDAYEVDSLKVPLPPGVPAAEVLMPREGSDTERERRAKFAWKADMYVTVDLQQLVSKTGACGGSGPGTLPTEQSGSLPPVLIEALGSVCPGATVEFRATHPLLTCDEFDARADLEIDAGAGGQSTRVMDGCVFSYFIPLNADRLEIEIRLDDQDYAQLVADADGRSRWLSWDCNGQSGFVPWPKITVTRSGGLQVPQKQEICDIFAWQWANYYDGRELNFMDVMNFNIAELTAWVGGSASRATEIVYFEFIVPETMAGYHSAAVALLRDGAVDAAVRLVNGAVLPNRMTVATHHPLYVKGDYNSVSWKSAALVGDALTILSNSWLDAAHQDPVVIKTGASPTQVWAAVLAGHSATPCDHEDAGCSGGYTDFYGGGIENFPRFLESWGSSNPFTYRGSLVSLHTSQIAIGTWNGSYYSPPKRDWQFDTRFEDPANLPPGTPVVGQVIRTAFRPVYQ